MGNPSHIKVYAELIAFLEANGRSLDDFGTSERGLSIKKTKDFLELLLVNSVPLFGIEIWRHKNGYYHINGAESWYRIHDGANANHADALQYLSDIESGSNDVFTI